MLQAKVVPYSSVVGSSLIITQDGKTACLLSLLSVGGDTRDEHRAKSEALAHALCHAINNGVYNANQSRAKPTDGSLPNEPR
jgi:hypothetical protein